jgi:hypothetical protein
VTAIRSLVPPVRLGAVRADGPTPYDLLVFGGQVQLGHGTDLVFSLNGAAVLLEPLLRADPVGLRAWREATGARLPLGTLGHVTSDRGLGGPVVASARS